MTFKEKHDILTKYIEMKLIEKDWHGVSDAANDLRVLEASNNVPIDLPYVDIPFMEVKNGEKKN